MRVGIDGKVLWPPRAGMARYLEGLLGALRAPRQDGLEIGVVSPERRRRTVSWVLLDLQRETARGWDVFHCPFYYPPLAPRCPVTVAIHDVLVIEHPEWFSRRFANTLRLMIPAGARRAAGVITGSTHAAEAIATLCRVPRERIKVIRYGLERELFHPPSASEVDVFRRRSGLERPFLLQVGALEPRRGVDLTLEAFRMLRSRFTDLELVIVGEERRAVAGLREPVPGVRRLGRVEDRDLPALYAAAEVVVAPSRGEGFDLPVLEALGCSGLVVASDIGVHVEHFAPAVELFESGNAAALAAAVENVLLSPERAVELRRAGPAHAAGFSWDDTARTHVELWKEVVA